MRKSKYTQAIEVDKQVYLNPVRHYTVKQVRAFAKARGMKVSPNVGKPLHSLCDCGEPVDKRYYTQCNDCHRNR